MSALFLAVVGDGFYGRFTGSMIRCGFCFVKQLQLQLLWIRLLARGVKFLLLAETKLLFIPFELGHMLGVLLLQLRVLLLKLFDCSWGRIHCFIHGY